MIEKDHCDWTINRRDHHCHSCMSLIGLQGGSGYEYQLYKKKKPIIFETGLDANGC